MEHIDVFRMSASRPWQLEKTIPPCKELIKYSGELRWHLIESVLVEDLSNECIRIAKDAGYEIHIIDPAAGQGTAYYHALQHAVTSKYHLKWEDDFMPEVEIPLDICVGLMEKYPHINQISFNKRETADGKYWGWKDGERRWWIKEQRYFELNGEQIPLVVKEKWWLGSAIARTSFINKAFDEYVNKQGRDPSHNIHNNINGFVIMKWTGFDGSDNSIPDAKKIEETIGTYIYGKVGDPRMVFHCGLGDSIWTGELINKWKKEGKTIKRTEKDKEVILEEDV